MWNYIFIFYGYVPGNPQFYWWNCLISYEPLDSTIKKMTDFVYLAAKWNWFRILSFKLNLSHNITNMIGLSICFLMTRPPSPIRNGLYHNISHWKWRWTQIYVTYPSLFPSSSQVSDSRIGHLASDTSWLKSWNSQLASNDALFQAIDIL